jgi:acyl carrier protein
MNNFYEDMANLLEADTVKDEDVLKSFECWDFLTRLTIIATADSKYGVNISADDVDNAMTIGGVKKLFKIE